MKEFLAIQNPSDVLDKRHWEQGDDISIVDFRLPGIR